MKTKFCVKSFLTRVRKGYQSLSIEEKGKNIKGMKISLKVKKKRWLGTG